MWTICRSEKDGCVTLMINGDIGYEARAAACLFDQVRRTVGRQQMNPSEANAGWIARMIEPLLMEKIGRLDVDGLGCGVLRRGACLQQIAKP